MFIILWHFLVHFVHSELLHGRGRLPPVKLEWVHTHKSRWVWYGLFFGVNFPFSPDSDSYGGSYFQKGGRATNHFGGLDVAPGCHCRVQRTWFHCCAIVGCHCSVLWWGQGKVTTNFGGVDVVPLLGAIARCHCSVLWWGQGRVTTNFGGARAAIAGCHCSVLWFGGRVVANFGGVDVVPLQGAIVVCYGLGRG